MDKEIRPDLQLLSVCGVICSTDCKAFKQECAGCRQLQGKVAWAEFYGQEHCPIYACVSQKGIATCKQCGKAPCQIWLDTRNPDASEAEFQADIASRLKHLAEME